MTIKKILGSIVLVPLAVVLLLFGFANREPVLLTLNPFNFTAAADSALSFTAPLFIWLIVFAGIGMLVGSAVTWCGQHKYRKAARKNARQLAALHSRFQQQGQNTLPPA